MTRRGRSKMPRWLAVIIVVVALAGAAYEWIMEQKQQSATPQPTSASATRLPATASTSGTWYELYFTNPQYPDNPKDHKGGLDEKLVALMDRAQKTLDVADYDFDLANVADAMVRAKQRGVKVRMVTDSDTLNHKDEKIQAALRKLRSARIAIAGDDRSPIMHHKFTIVDGEWVSTGSWNYTDGDTYRLNNWMGIFHSRELAANYAAEFEQMADGKFGAARKKNVPYPSLTIGSTRVQTCFSPKGDCANLIVDTLRRETNKSIYFMAFSFTHDEIGAAIIEKHKAGVKVVGVFETTGSQTDFSEYGQMKKAGLEVYTDGNPYVMHHKVIILDERLVIAGSFNFSANADKDNDENLLILDDPAIARLFKAEFDRVLDVAKRPPR